MNTTPNLDYDEVDAALQQAGAIPDAAESHGILCGLTCAGGRPDAQAWMGQVLADTDPANAMVVPCRSVLEQLYQDTMGQLNDSALDFRLLLPMDADPLPDRAKALGKWCEGFLFGLGMGGVKDTASLPGTVPELIKDMSEISRVEFDIDSPEDADEAAYTEIVEYVRVGVLLINEELHPTKAPPRLQ
ncbi:MAG: UPF0149 family protein [Gammaproteobacteria bacterium]|jgi:uncharacterized protein